MPDFQKGVDKSEYAQSSISDLLLHTSSRSVLSYFQLGRIGVSGAISNSYSHSEWVAVAAGGDFTLFFSNVKCPGEVAVAYALLILCID